MIPPPRLATCCAAIALVLAGCGPAESQAPPLGGPAGDSALVSCERPRSAPLPGALRETSGVAISRRYPGILWSHNDSGSGPVLYAVDTTGVPRARVDVQGASNVDWEDIAPGPCAEGDCLYIADTGDNDGERRDVVIYRVPEPDLGAPTTSPATPIRFRYPGGPRDAEGLAVAPDGELILVTRGRHGTRRVYRVPTVAAGGAAGAGAGEDGDDGSASRVATAEPVLDLGPPPAEVTGAGLSPDGRWLAVRTERQLRFFRRDRGGALSPVGDASGIDLTALNESQGEAVALDDRGVVYLTSEGEDGAPPLLTRLECDLP